MKENKLMKSIILFLSIMFVFTIVSRVRDTIRTPQVKVVYPSAQVISYELEKKLVVEDAGEGNLAVRTELTVEEEGYIDSAADVHIEDNSKNVYIEEVQLSVSKANSGRTELKVTFNDDAVELGDTVTVRANYVSQPYPCCIPTSALHISKDNRYFVYVTEQQDVILGERIIAKAVEVEVEEQNQRYAALKNESLGNEDQVIYEANKEFQGNERVRVIEGNER